MRPQSPRATHGASVPRDREWIAADATFANVLAVREEAKDDSEVLEISVDTKAEVAEGEYAHGKKIADGVGP